jgi:hypothetical protein
MQYSTRSLFAFVTAVAVVSVILRMPVDFIGFFLAMSVAATSVAGCFYLALSKKTVPTYVVVLAYGWTTAVMVCLILLEFRLLRLPR